MSENSLDKTDYLIQKHDFTEVEEKRLDAAIRTFAIFENYGLGKKDFEKYFIKNRFRS